MAPKTRALQAVTLLDKSVLDTAEGQVLLTTLLVRRPERRAALLPATGDCGGG